STGISLSRLVLPRRSLWMTGHGDFASFAVLRSHRRSCSVFHLTGSRFRSKADRESLATKSLFWKRLAYLIHLDKPLTFPYITTEIEIQRVGLKRSVAGPSPSASATVCLLLIHVQTSHKKKGRHM